MSQCCLCLCLLTLDDIYEVWCEHFVIIVHSTSNLQFRTVIINNMVGMRTCDVGATLMPFNIES
jgi:hypothetical protein